MQVEMYLYSYSLHSAGLCTSFPEDWVDVPPATQNYHPGRRFTLECGEGTNHGGATEVTCHGNDQWEFEGDIPVCLDGNVFN